MDEGDDYVPQISQLDYSLVGDGSAVISSDSHVYAAQSQVRLLLLSHSLHIALFFLTLILQLQLK